MLKEHVHYQRSTCRSTGTTGGKGKKTSTGHCLLLLGKRVYLDLESTCGVSSFLHLHVHTVVDIIYIFWIIIIVTEFAELTPPIIVRYDS